MPAWCSFSYRQTRSYPGFRVQVVENRVPVPDPRGGWPLQAPKKQKIAHLCGVLLISGRGMPKKHKHTNAQTYTYINIQTYKHINIQVHKHTNTQTHKHTNMQTHKHTNIHTEDIHTCVLTAPIWPCVGLCALIWPCVNISAPTWPCVGLFALILPCVSFSAPIWRYVGFSVPTHEVSRT